MNSARSRLVALSAAALFVFGACSASATPAPSSGPKASQVATVPDDQLLFKGKLVVCSDMPYPPQEFFDAQGNPVGADIDMAKAIAARLGLTADIQNSVFDTIIAAVTGGKCDVIMSAMTITPDRQKQLDMIPYFMAGQAFLVTKGNPKAFKTLDDLCGKNIGAESGTTEAAYVKGTDAYAGKGLIKACTDKGKAAPTLKEYSKDSETVGALQASQIDIYFGDVPVVANYATEKAAQFEFAPIPALEGQVQGIALPKDKTGLRDAIVKALVASINDGSYLAILKQYKIDAGAIKATDVKP